MRTVLIALLLILSNFAHAYREQSIVGTWEHRWAPKKEVIRTIYTFKKDGTGYVMYHRYTGEDREGRWTTGHDFGWTRKDDSTFVIHRVIKGDRDKEDKEINENVTIEETEFGVRMYYKGGTNNPNDHYLHLSPLDLDKNLTE